MQKPPIKNSRYKLVVTLVCIHLCLVFTRSINTIRPNKNLIENGLFNAALNTYTQYTVMQADYAFFSPDVAATPSLKIKVNTAVDSFYLPFNKRHDETGIRLFTSLNAFNNTPEARELMTRSWAAYALKKYPGAETITVSFYINDPSSFTRYAAGKQAAETLLFEVKYEVDAE